MGFDPNQIADFALIINKFVNDVPDLLNYKAFKLDSKSSECWDERGNLTFRGFDKLCTPFLYTSSFMVWLNTGKVFSWRDNQPEIFWTIAFDDSWFSAGVKFSQESPEAATKFATTYEHLIEAWKWGKPQVPKVFYDNTHSFAENDQVFIITRLPRAGLVSLLSTDAK